MKGEKNKGLFVIVYMKANSYVIMLKHGLSWKMDSMNLNVHTISISKTSLSTRALTRALIRINIKIILIANTYNYLSHALFHLLNTLPQILKYIFITI